MGSNRVLVVTVLIVGAPIVVGQLTTAEHQVVPILDKAKVRVYMDGLVDAWAIFADAGAVMEEVIDAAGSAGIPVEQYEQKYNQNSSNSNAYRDSITLEIWTHALGYPIELLHINYWILYGKLYP